MKFKLMLLAGLCLSTAVYAGCCLGKRQELEVVTVCSEKKIRRALEEQGYSAALLSQDTVRGLAGSTLQSESFVHHLRRICAVLLENKEGKLGELSSEAEHYAREHKIQVLTVRLAVVLIVKK